MTSIKQLRILILLVLISIPKITFSQYNPNTYSIDRNGKKGYVDNNLNIIVKPIYDEIGGFKETFFGNYSIIKLENKFGLINIKGKVVLKPKYDGLSYTSSPRILKLKNGKSYGLINTKGTILLKPIYDYGLELINNGETIIVNKDNKYALFDIKGNKITDFIYDRLNGKFDSNLIAFNKGGKWGYVSCKGEIIIEPKFDYANTFDNNYARITLNRLDRLINKKGEIVSDTLIDKINFYQYSFFSDHKLLEVNSKMYYFKKGKKIGLMNDSLKIIVEPIYDEISNFNEGYAYVKKDNKYGYINVAGEVVIPIFYEDAEYFSEGLAPVVKNGKWGFIDTKNDVKIDFKFKGYVNPFFEGLAVYRKREYPSSKAHYTNDKCGYINMKGEIEIEPTFRDARRFINGVAKVEDSNNKYLINIENKRISLNRSEEQVIEMIEEN